MILRIHRAAPARVFGLDASLNCTGYAYRDRAELVTGTIPVKKIVGPERLVYVRDILGRVLDHANPTHVILEDYAMGATGKVFGIGEMGGVLRALIWERNIPIVLVGPTQLKLIIAGHGHAAKTRADAVKRAAKKNTPLVPNMCDAIKRRFLYHIDQPDEADAFALMALGEARYRSMHAKQFTREQLAEIAAMQVIPVKKPSNVNLKSIARRNK